MTQPTNKRVTSLTDFVDLVFVELSSHDNKWNPHEEGYGYYDNPDCLKDTLIPLAKRLYELAQVDDKVYWWLLQLMSQVDFCKDSKDDLGKSDVFTVLSTLKRKHQKIVLGKCVPAYADGLQKALDDNSLDAFMSVLPTTDENVTVCNVSRVLKRAREVRAIYDDTMSHTEGDSLGRLFVLFRQYYYYFADAYKENQRPCDGMAKNIFLALYQTQYSEDKLSFCSVADRIGGLWVRSLMLAYFQYEEQLPQTVKEVLLDVLQGQNADDFNQMKSNLNNFLTDEKKEAFVSDKGGWLEIEKYSFIYRDVLEREWPKITPPFSCKIIGRIRGKYSRCRIIAGERIKNELPDNCVPYLKTKNAVPLEELEAVATSEEVQNIQRVAEKPHESTLLIPGQIKLYKDDDCNGEYKTISLSFEKKVPFLKELADNLSNNDYFSRGGQENFIHAFDGTTVSSESHTKINWKESAASLFALCYVLFDEKITGKWPIIANLFIVKGKLLDTSNASGYKTGTKRRIMQNYVKEALEKIGIV